MLLVVKYQVPEFTHTVKVGCIGDCIEQFVIAPVDNILSALTHIFRCRAITLLTYEFVGAAHGAACNFTV